jgi:basic amino acid/polyamine antiporter, APA family
MADGNTMERVAAPRQVLNTKDGIAIIVGIVIGAGIFKSPSIVAANVGSEAMMMFAWLLGGLISLAGALCYAELATAYPSTGGEYNFLTRAYGNRLAFLFAWSRLAILQTGSIALLAFVFGDYLAALLPAGTYGPAIYAGLAVVVFTALNIVGLRASTSTLKFMMVTEIIGLAAIIGLGLAFAPATPAVDVAGATGGGSSAPVSAFGLAMVFVLLTYGGWNESAYVSAELRDVRRNMVRSLVIALLIVTAVYLLANLAYVKVLGLEGMRSSEVVATDMLRASVGGIAPEVITALIVLAVMTSINVTIITGARTNYAMARDFPLFRFLARWDSDSNTPVTAMIVQAAITLLLIVIGAVSRAGFQTMVDYVSPVFWFFFLLTVFSLFILRKRDPGRERPFRVPLYPAIPLLFCAACAYMLYSSLAYTRFGALLGVAVLAAGVPLLFFLNRNPSFGQIPLKAEHRTGGGS